MTHQPQSENANDVHEDMAALAQNNGVKRHKGLGRAKAHKCLGIGLKKVSVLRIRILQRSRRRTAQNKKRMIVARPPNPLATVLQKIPRAAVMEAFLVSSAT